MSASKRGDTPNPMATTGNDRSGVRKPFMTSSVTQTPMVRVMNSPSSIQKNPDSVAPTASYTKVELVGFEYLRGYNFDLVEEALNGYLTSEGFLPHSHSAELIMFMERSFYGKYKLGEKSHYQHILPCNSVREGDSLSEKLTRCKDKETFPRRFLPFGATTILRRHHFDKFEIGNFDFDGKLYLRLIDTKRNNRSWFFRNDSAVKSLMRLARDYYKPELSGKNGKSRNASLTKPEVIIIRKPELVALEIPSPLLNRDGQEKETRKAKQSSLTLVHSSTIGKNQKPTPGKTTTSYDGSTDTDEWIAEQCGISTINGKSADKEKRSAPSHSGIETFNLWRTSVLVTHPSECITESPTKVLIGEAAKLDKRFREFYPEAPIADFFAELTTRWGTVCKELKDRGVWQNLGPYPEIPSLHQHSNHVLSWYKNVVSQSKSKQQGLQQSPVPGATIPEIAAPLVGCPRVTAEGRTFNRNEVESLEYQIAYRSHFYPEKHRMGVLSMLSCNIQMLVKQSLNMAASNARIEQLKQIPPDELDRYCC